MDTGQTRRTRIRRTLGWGVAAPLVSPGDVGRDLVMARRPGSSRLDLACVEGAANLGQDLAVALTTGKGDDPFNVEFGFDGLAALVEAQAPSLVRERLRASVAKTVARDPRVRTVTAVEAQEGSSGPTRTLGLRVEVDTIASEAASLTTLLG
jgi:phage baseplate assembly protein W